MYRMGKYNAHFRIISHSPSCDQYALIFFKNILASTTLCLFDAVTIELVGEGLNKHSKSEAADLPRAHAVCPDSYSKLKIPVPYPPIFRNADCCLSHFFCPFAHSTRCAEGAVTGSGRWRRGEIWTQSHM